MTADALPAGALPAGAEVGPFNLPAWLEDTFIPKYAVGDVVRVTISPDSRAWGGAPCPDGTLARVLGYTGIMYGPRGERSPNGWTEFMQVGDAVYRGPGVNTAWVRLLLETGTEIELGMCHSFELVWRPTVLDAYHAARLRSRQPTDETANRLAELEQLLRDMFGVEDELAKAEARVAELETELAGLRSRQTRDEDGQRASALTKDERMLLLDLARGSRTTLDEMLAIAKAVRLLDKLSPSTPQNEGSSQ